MIVKNVSGMIITAKQPSGFVRIMPTKIALIEETNAFIESLIAKKCLEVVE